MQQVEGRRKGTIGASPAPTPTAARTSRDISELKRFQGPKLWCSDIQLISCESVHRQRFLNRYIVIVCN